MPSLLPEQATSRVFIRTKQRERSLEPSESSDDVLAEFEQAAEAKPCPPDRKRVKRAVASSTGRRPETFQAVEQNADAAGSAVDVGHRHVCENPILSAATVSARSECAAQVGAPPPRSVQRPPCEAA